MEQALIDYFSELQRKVRQYLDSLEMRTYYVRNGVQFRATSHFYGAVWRDWVLIDWGEEGKLPCHIMGFVDLSDLPPNYEFNFQGSNGICPGIYAIVQYAEFVDDEAEQNMSELFLPIEKHVAGITLDHVTSKKLFCCNMS